MKEKKVLNAEEIEAQMLIELPDRNLMQQTVDQAHLIRPLSIWRFKLSK